ncbi:sequence similarity 65, member C [Parelaphostrongylus tenuis]|uniref:Sequence similarity 65, member C n=1 Tax=Parelaphostrongylus tenuis TaxID=148309 RepID=A0AAD5WIS0_PARTN|nr:sequence similarity 65, member C [Parelaphostrongylus tenuis]
MESPLVYKSTETLKRLQIETVTLDNLLRIANTVPAIPNVTAVLGEINADPSVKEIGYRLAIRFIPNCSCQETIFEHK